MGSDRRVGWCSTGRWPALLGAMCMAWGGYAAAQVLTSSEAALTAKQLQVSLQAAQTDAGLYQRLYATGRKVAAVCAHCHGAQTQPALLDVPYLEGQNSAYLVEQIRQFSQGTRKNAFMQGILKALSRDEIVGMAIFYEQQPLPARAARDQVMAARGQAYYERVCINCHGPQGRGSAVLPRIAGQHAGYVELTLQRYRAGNRVRSNATMEFVTQGMTDSDIRGVAAYLVTLP